MAKLEYYKNTFEYFRRFKPSIIKGNVLDYGSNYGTFLDSSNNLFPQENYTGIDVDAVAIQEGRLKFPSAKFIWYNGYNVAYNPTGTDNSYPLPQQYDTIISYSVFTHTDKEDMLYKIKWLYSYLKPGGTILATWLDVDSKATTDFFYKKRIATYGKCDTIDTTDYIYLLDNYCSKTIKPDVKFLLSFYKRTYLLELLSEYKPLLLNAFADIPSCFQSCLVIQKNN